MLSCEILVLRPSAPVPPTTDDGCPPTASHGQTGGRARAEEIETRSNGRNASQRQRGSRFLLLVHSRLLLFFVRHAPDTAGRCHAVSITGAAAAAPATTANTTLINESMKAVMVLGKEEDQQRRRRRSHWATAMVLRGAERRRRGGAVRQWEAARWPAVQGRPCARSGNRKSRQVKEGARWLSLKRPGGKASRLFPTDGAWAIGIFPLPALLRPFTTAAVDAAAAWRSYGRRAAPGGINFL